MVPVQLALPVFFGWGGARLNLVGLKPGQTQSQIEVLSSFNFNIFMFYFDLLRDCQPGRRDLSQPVPVSHSHADTWRLLCATKG